MSTPAANITGAQPTGLSASEIESMVRNFMAKGETESRVAILLTENFQYREKNRQLTEQLTQTQAKVPAEGSLVLTGEDLKTYNEFVALKLKPSEIVELQGKLTKLDGEVTAAKRKEAISTAAQAEGYEPTVLATLVGDKELVTKPIDEDVDGEKKKVDRAFILTKGANDVVTEERLSKFIEDNHSKFLPALTQSSEDTGTGKGGTPYPAQRASTGGKPAKSDASQSYIQKRYGTKPAQGAAK